MHLEKKSLEPTKRVCLRLKEARESRNVSLEEMSDRLKMSKNHLRSLEDCRFDDLPFAMIYQKNLMKRYLIALGIDPTDLLEQFLHDEVQREEEEAPKLRGTRIRQYPNIPLLLRSVGVGLVVLILLGYLALQVRHILQPPKLTVYQPQDGFVTVDADIHILGETERGVQTFINGKEIASNEQGIFDEMIHLNTGVNTITVQAVKKHGKTTETTRVVVLQERKNVVPVSNVSTTTVR